jgi:hypothetical protein
LLDAICGNHTPTLTENENVVQPTASARLALNDWTLTTSTALPMYRQAFRPVNAAKPS